MNHVSLDNSLDNYERRDESRLYGSLPNFFGLPGQILTWQTLWLSPL